MTVPYSYGGQTLLDRASEALRGGVDAQYVAIVGEVSDLDAATTADRDISPADGRNPIQGTTAVQLGCEYLDDEDLGSVGRRLERWVLRARCIWRKTKVRTNGAGAKTASMQEQSWRCAHALARSAQIVLRRDLLGGAGIYNTEAGRISQETQDPLQPEIYVVLVEIAVWMEVFDAPFTPAPT